MGSVKLLLDQARSAGLTVEAHGDKLVVRGPKRAEAIVRELVQHKAAVMEVLTAPPVTKTAQTNIITMVLRGSRGRSVRVLRNSRRRALSRSLRATTKCTR